MLKSIQKAEAEKLESIEKQISLMENRKSILQSTLSELIIQRNEIIECIYNTKLDELSKGISYYCKNNYIS